MTRTFCVFGFPGGFSIGLVQLILGLGACDMREFEIGARLAHSPRKVQLIANPDWFTFPCMVLSPPKLGKNLPQDFEGDLVDIS